MSLGDVNTSTSPEVNLMGIPRMRRSICASIEKNLGPGKQSPTYFASVHEHHEEFGIESLKKYITRTPACIVAHLDGKGGQSNAGQFVGDGGWVAMIVTEDQDRIGRHDLGLILMEPLMDLVYSSGGFTGSDRWGDSVLCIHRSKNIRWQKVRKPELDDMGISLIAVTWEQGLDFARRDADTLDAFIQANADWDLAPKDGEIDMQSQANPEQP